MPTIRPDTRQLEGKIGVGQIVLGQERLHPGIDQIDEPPHHIDGDGDRADDDEAGEEIAAEPRAEMRRGRLLSRGSTSISLSRADLLVARLRNDRRLVVGFHGVLESVSVDRQSIAEAGSARECADACQIRRGDKDYCASGETTEQSTPFRFSALQTLRLSALSGKGPTLRL